MNNRTRVRIQSKNFDSDQSIDHYLFFPARVCLILYAAKLRKTITIIKLWLYIILLVCLGGGTYEIKPDGVDIDLEMKIEVNGQGKPGGGGAGEVPGGGIDTNGQGKPGGGAGEVPGAGASPTPTPKPALCPVPCSQTKPTTSQGFTIATTPGGGATGARTAPTVPSGGTGGVTPTQGPGGSPTEPTTGGLAATTPPPSGGGGGKEAL